MMVTLRFCLAFLLLPACGGSGARPHPEPSGAIASDAAATPTTPDPPRPGSSEPDATGADVTGPDASSPGATETGKRDAGTAGDVHDGGGRDASTAGGTDARVPDAAAAPGPPVVSLDAATAADATAAPPPVNPARLDFFRPEVIHQISLTIDPARWDAYLGRHRSFPVPPGDKWFAGDFVIDGTPLRNVGFHGFGWGSRFENANKPNLSIDIDRNVPGQSLRGIERMRLKNNGQDVSGLRQTLLYQAMRESSLLAPRSTFAELTVNGRSYGFYFVEEAFSHGFLRERTGNEDGATYEPTGCQGFVSPVAGGCDRIGDHFDRPFNPAAGRGEDLVALCQVMNGPADRFLGSVGTLIALPEWIDQVAIDTALAGNLDGFSASGGNFRLYHDTRADRLRLVILGPDDTFETDYLPAPSFRAPEPHQSCRAKNPLYRDIFLEKLTATEEGLTLYRNAVRRLRTGVLSPGTIERRVNELWAIIGPRVQNDPLLNPDDDPGRSKDEILEYVRRRWQALQDAGF
jgi:CotH kinase protein